MTLQDYATPPAVIVVTDLDHRLFPARRWWPFTPVARDDLPERLAEAGKVLVGHRQLSALLREHYGVANEKIAVVGHGPTTTDWAVDTVSRRITKEVYGREGSFFFAPATGHPADNLGRLLSAYDGFRARCSEPVRLLLPLTQKALSRADRRTLKKLRHREDIDFLPALPPTEYRKVFASARAILYPSSSSAFPTPIVDAWHAEVPVMAVDNDVLGGAGARVPGTEQEAMTEAMLSLVTTPFLASGLVENGKRRREEFTWEQVAARIAEVITELR